MAFTMAEIFRKFAKNHNYFYSPLVNTVRYSSKQKKPKLPKGTPKYRNLIESSCQSLAARGFLRSQKTYTPQKDVTERIQMICQQILGKNYSSENNLSREEKFVVLTECFYKLQHCVPNSILNKVNNVNDIIEFYQTPVSTTTPYDELKNQELPPNLHIQYDYVRFDPDTDTKFKGITAFPRSSTIVTGLKYKNKYKGVKQPSPYKDTEVHFDKTLGT